MKVSVCYSEQAMQLWLKLEVDTATTVAQAIHQSGILKRVPTIDLDQQKVGVFGKPVKLDRILQEGERVEIYRPITAIAEDDDEDG
jgi:putative ubiquitin-RnfH superfamily antitoxin RatB of RatAB toxin-antitoxin module